MTTAALMAAAAMRRQYILRCIAVAGPDGLARRDVARNVSDSRDAINYAMFTLADAGLIVSTGRGMATRWFLPCHWVAAARAAEERAVEQIKRRKSLAAAEKRARKSRVAAGEPKIVRTQSVKIVNVTKPRAPVLTVKTHDLVPCSIWRYAEMVGSP